MTTPTETTVLSEEERACWELHKHVIPTRQDFDRALSTIRTLQVQVQHLREIRSDDVRVPQAVARLDEVLSITNSYKNDAGAWLTVRGHMTALQAREKRLREKVALLSIALYGAIGTIQSVRELDNPEHQIALDAVLEESRAAGPMTSVEARTALSGDKA